MLIWCLLSSSFPHVIYWKWDMIIWIIFSRYAWILLVVFQLLMTNVSLLGHLCGILSGFACEFPLCLIHLSPSHFLVCLLPVLLYYISNSVDILISDTNGLFNFLMPGTSFYSAIEASSWLVSIFMKLAFLLQKHYGESNVCFLPWK